MYNLAKLLTEEPHKIERLLILLSKLIIVFFLTGWFYGFNLSLGTIVENPFPKELTAAKIIYFFASVIIVWFVVLNLILELLFTQLPIWLITRNKNGKGVVDSFLSFFDIAYAYGTDYVRGKNIVGFTRSLKKNDDLDDLEDADSRVRQYYQLSLVAFISLLFFTDISIPGWTIYFFISAIVSFFLLSVLASLAHKYLSVNYDSLKRHFTTLSYYQKVSDSIHENPLISTKYSIVDRNNKIDMTKITTDNFPSQINIHIFHYRNQAIANFLFQKEISELEDNQSGLDFIFCNIEPSISTSKQILKNRQLVLIVAKTQSQMLTGFEEAFCKLGVDYRRKPITKK